MPNERDESAGSQSHAIPHQSVDDADAIGRKAAQDVKAGRKDTGTGPVLDRVFRGLGPQGAPRPRRRP